MKPTEIRAKLMRRMYVYVMERLEDELAARPDVVQAATDSPVRFEIMHEALKRGQGPPPSLRAMPHMAGSMSGIRRSLTSVDDNPAQPRTHMPEADLARLEAYARSVGVDDIGYAHLSEELVFQRKAVLHPNAIVLTMEMDKARMETAPSEQSFVEVHAVYNNLGRAANRIAAWLKQQGFSAQAGPALMGTALYPPLGQRAGLGWRGLHGLLITPRFGPRVRLAAVYTSIKNLPLARENPHSWIEDYCRKCRLCAKECPPQAILEQPLKNSNGLVTCTLTDKCFPYFIDNYGCSICIGVCPFQRGEYAKLKESLG